MKILNSYLSTWGATQRISVTDKVSNDWMNKRSGVQSPPTPKINKSWGVTPKYEYFKVKSIINIE